ncbi:MAG: hypothetical protein RLZZ221_485 [Verrucomicrobiota bacterium]
MQPDGVPHESVGRMLRRESAVQFPVIGPRADGDHRRNTPLPRPLEHRRQVTPPRERLEMRVRVEKFHRGSGSGRQSRRGVQTFALLSHLK